MKKECKFCGQQIPVDDLLEYYDYARQDGVVCHLTCYARVFNAPHVLGDKKAS